MVELGVNPEWMILLEHIHQLLIHPIGGEYYRNSGTDSDDLNMFNRS